MKIAMLFPEGNYERGISNYSKDLIDAIKQNGLNVDPVTYKNRKFISLLKVIPPLKKFDIIHIQHENRLFGFIDGFWFMPFITLLKIMTKGKILITFHTVHTKQEKLFSIYNFLNFLKRNFTHPLNYLFANFFTKLFIVHTSFLKEDLIKNSKIKENKIIVIPQGVRSDRPHFNKVTVKKTLHLKGNVYLMIGTMGPNKGFEIILRQAKKIGKTILIVGGFGSRPDYITELKKYIRENDLQDIVRFDFKDTPLNLEEWWSYIHASDMLLLPYVEMTTSGIFINAMEAGKPVVGSNSRYFSEVSKDYKCIKIADKEEDYVSQIKETLKEKKEMEKDSRRFARENSILLMGKKYKRLYEDL